jgi:hypothetical protein
VAKTRDAYSVKSSRTGQTYYLHQREVTLRNGRKQTIYFFARKAGAGAMEELPPGYKVIESERTGLPMLKKSS